MTIRCDDCGKPTADALGSRQCSLLDADDDPRIDVLARVDLRRGRILCPACARGVRMYEEHVTAAECADAVADLD